jgi:peptide/nickel transport system substrate-binding protein
MLGWGGAITDPQTSLDPVLHTWDEKSKKGFYNYGRYTNTKADQAIDAAGTEADPVKRRELLKTAQSELRDQMHNIPLHRQFIPWAARANVDMKHYADNYVRAWTTSIK